ncbi:hypothetical protein, partial [Nostoc linckia]|uniref:hypothetical protein n=1 Tax=Nostoc linckia TaxID=92942 RepID=UPI001A7EB966
LFRSGDCSVLATQILQKGRRKTGHHHAKTGKLYAKAESLSLSRFGALFFLMVQSIASTLHHQKE